MFAAYLPLLLSALAFVISVFSLFYFRSYLKARTGQARILAEMREEVNSILKSINETTDRDISLIEEREKNLKALLEDIEKRLKVYIREVEVRRGAEEAYRELGKNRYRLPQDPPRESDPHGESDLSGESESPGEPETRREAARQNRNGDSRDAARQAKPNPAFPVPNFEVKSESASGRPQENLPPLGEQVLSLVRAGFSVPVIASRLGISIAEVEFAAALLDRRDVR
jgi:hypothetical protein